MKQGQRYPRVPEEYFDVFDESLERAGLGETELRASFGARSTASRAFNRKNRSIPTLMRAAAQARELRPEHHFPDPILFVVDLDQSEMIRLTEALREEYPEEYRGAIEDLRQLLESLRARDEAGASLRGHSRKKKPK